MNVSVRRKFVSCRRFLLPSSRKTSVIGKPLVGTGGLTGSPGTLRRTRLVPTPATAKLGTTWLPGAATGVGTAFKWLPSTRTVKAAKLFPGFKPSGLAKVWKRTVSLSRNLGQQVEKKSGLGNL